MTPRVDGTRRSLHQAPLSLRTVLQPSGSARTGTPIADAAWRLDRPAGTEYPQSLSHTVDLAFRRGRVLIEQIMIAAARPVYAFALLFSLCVGQSSGGWAIAVHGGAGETEWEHMDAQTAAAYRASLARALQSGVDQLNRGARALDAVEAAIKVLEDDPLFNAGRGSAFTSEGKNEMDASIMDGATLEAGSVAGVSRTRNPISLARAVMEKSPYVMMTGPGADSFGARVHLPEEPPSYFFTEMRWREVLQILRARGSALPARPPGAPPAPMLRSP